MAILGNGAGSFHLALIDRHHAAIALLHLFRNLERQAQTDGHVTGELITGNRQYGGMPDAAILEDTDIGGAATDIGEDDAYLFLILCQHRFARSQRLQHHIINVDTDATDAFDQVLDGCCRRCNDVCFHVQPEAVHAYRILDTHLPVYCITARDNMQAACGHWGR